MSLTQKEKNIREKRTILAASKNFIGVAGRLGTIAKYLGSPIKYQGNKLVSDRTLDEYLGEPYDVYDQPNRDELPVFDEREDFIETIGYMFDGLSRGIHMEIKYMYETKILTVHWKGYQVYMEVAGDLFAYAPFDEWETKIDTLYKQAEKLAVIARKEYQIAEEEEAKQKQMSFLQRLRLRWGI